MPLVVAGPFRNNPHELAPPCANFETIVWKLPLVVSGLIQASTLMAVVCWRLGGFPKLAKSFTPSRSKA